MDNRVLTVLVVGMLLTMFIAGFGSAFLLNPYGAETTRTYTETYTTTFTSSQGASS